MNVRLNDALMSGPGTPAGPRFHLANSRTPGRNIRVGRTHTFLAALPV